MLQPGHAAAGRRVERP